LLAVCENSKFINPAAKNYDLPLGQFLKSYWNNGVCELQHRLVDTHELSYSL